MQQEGKETSYALSEDPSAGDQPLPTLFRTIDSRELDSCVYIGEGNATFVVSLPHERKVIRFRKIDENSGDVPAEDGEKRRVELLVDFFKNVISGLMGRYANEPEIVRCKPKDVARWMSLLETQRPEHRRHKKFVETYATTLPNYTLLPRYMHNKLPSGKKRPTFCVEIKPKQGFVEKQLSLLGNKWCDYCRKQYAKMAEGKISSPSKYCPCDLFSGEPARMRRAVKGLADSPQNNFRIFKNGRLVWGEGFGPNQLDDVLSEWFFHDKPNDREAAREALFQLVHEALLRPFPQEQANSVPSTIAKLTSEAVRPTSLPRNSVLERILRVQKLNNYSLDFVYDIYSTHSSILNDEIVYMKPAVKLAGNNNLNESKLLPSAEELQILRNYLLFRLAKDCSILMAFQEIDSFEISVVAADNIIRIMESRCFVFNNAITDLDPKSVHCIAKLYRCRTAEISKMTTQGQGAYSDPSDARKETPI